MADGGGGGSGGGYAVGESLTVADLAVWRLLGWLSSGALDGISQDYVAEEFPGLAKLAEKVDAHEGVVAWKTAHPDFYK